MPALPDEPDVPLVPLVPDVPELPEVPLEPDEPDVPEVPAVPDVEPVICEPFKKNEPEILTSVKLICNGELSPSPVWIVCNVFVKPLALSAIFNKP